MKPQVFDIKIKHSDQIKLESRMSPNERLLLTLELMNLSIGLSQEKTLRQHKDNFDWIELTSRHE
jgi:hypothetical protein